MLSKTQATRASCRNRRRFSTEPVLKSSSTVTLWSRFKRASAKCEPTNPAPPVIKALTRNPPTSLDKAKATPRAKTVRRLSGLVLGLVGQQAVAQCAPHAPNTVFPADLLAFLAAATSIRYRDFGNAASELCDFRSDFRFKTEPVLPEVDS